MRRVILPAVLASLLLATGGARGMAPSPWLLPSVLSSPGSAYGLHVAVDERGAATVVWGSGGVYVVTRAPGGTFGRPTQIAPEPIWSGPDVGVDAAGRATVIWTSGAHPDVRLQATTGSQGAGFGPAVEIGRAPLVSRARVAVDPKGDAIVMWMAALAENDATGWALRSAFRPAGGAFGTIEIVATFVATSEVPRFDLAIGARGDAIATWVEPSRLRSSVGAAYRPAGTRFGSPVTLAEEVRGTEPDAPYAYLGDPDVGIDASGNAVVVWSRFGGSTRVVWAASRTAATRSWQAPVSLARSDDVSGPPATVAMDPRGNVTVAMILGAPRTVQVATRAAGSETWQPPQVISEPQEHVGWGVLAVAGARGDVIVAWLSSEVVVASVRPPGGRFGQVRDVSQSGVYVGRGPTASVDPQGNVIAVWAVRRSPLTRYSYLNVVQAAGYDGAGPELRSLRVPQLAPTGRRLAFSVTPLDVWSKVVATRWRFGDGTTASGPRTTHVYRRPGRFTVTVTSADALGHTTTAARAVRITEAAR